MDLIAHVTFHEIPSGFLLFITGFLAGVIATWSARSLAGKPVRRDK